MLFMLIAVAILLVLNGYQLQKIYDELKRIKQGNETKPKQFKREHSNISKTNFR